MGEPVTDPFPEIRINTASRTARKASASRQSSGSSVLSAPLLVIALASIAALLLIGGVLSTGGSKGKGKKRQRGITDAHASRTESGRHKSKLNRKLSAAQSRDVEKNSYTEGWDKGVDEGKYLDRGLRQLVEAGNDAAAERWLQNIANVVNSSIRNLDNADKGVKLLEKQLGSSDLESQASDYVIQVKAGHARCLGHYEGLMSAVGKYVQ